MPLFRATGRFFCKCGAETHAVMDGYQQGVNPRKHVINCWQCGHIVDLVSANKIWTASTPHGARQKRLHELHHMAVHWVKPEERQRSA